MDATTVGVGDLIAEATDLVDKTGRSTHPRLVAAEHGQLRPAR